MWPKSWPKIGKGRAMAENSLSAAIAGNLAQQEAEQPKPKPVKAANEGGAKPKVKKAKAPPKKTVLVGGHFPPAVLKQLRIIAAEDETTNQALIEEALDLLFAKKGKKKIENL